MNRPHPQFNFFPCSPEVPFFIRIYQPEYVDKQRTVISTEEFFPKKLMVDEEKMRMFCFEKKKESDEVQMIPWDISENCEMSLKEHWIFEYRLPS